HADAVTEQAVAPDVAEADLLLHESERVLIILPEREIEPAGPHAGAPGVRKRRDRVVGHLDAHSSPSGLGTDVAGPVRRGRLVAAPRRTGPPQRFTPSASLLLGEPALVRLVRHVDVLLQDRKSVV